MPSMQVDGREQRFCQQCGRFQDIGACVCAMCGCVCVRVCGVVWGGGGGGGGQQSGAGTGRVFCYANLAGSRLKVILRLPRLPAEF
jgi:hypothetical protein